MQQKSLTRLKNDDKPVRPAPATPNKDPIIATPAADPSVAAPAPPMMAPAPAAINGAARPPVSPAQTAQLTQKPDNNTATLLERSQSRSQRKINHPTDQPDGCYLFTVSNSCLHFLTLHFNSFINWLHSYLNKTQMRVTAASPSEEVSRCRRRFWALRSSEQHTDGTR